MAHTLNLKTPDFDRLVGRVLVEATPNGAMPEWKSTTQVSDRDANGQVTIVATQSVGDVRYFDAAGYTPGAQLAYPIQPACRNIADTPPHRPGFVQDLGRPPRIPRWHNRFAVDRH